MYEMHPPLSLKFGCDTLLFSFIIRVLHLTEREMCPWAISKYFGDWVQTQGPKCENMLMDEQSVNHK
jgi:hypothetical protein